jgi:tRNA-modifying protein YgfZ
MDQSSAAAVLAAYEAMEGPGATALTHRDLVEVSGPEAGRYLQGQLSQEVVAMPVGSSTWSLLLQPTGKVDAWLRVHRVTEEDYALDVDQGWGDVVVARLRRFLLRTKAEIREPVVRRVLATRHVASRVAIGATPVGADGGWLAGVVVGPAVAGIDRIVPDDAELPDQPLVPEAALERHRVAHGVPRMGAELDDATIPAEGGQWLVDASVSFTKGCYTGQELVARIDSRGSTVPRPVRLLRLDLGPTDDRALLGASVRHDGADVGRVTSAVPALADHQPALALAVVARSVPVGASVVVGDGAVTGTVVDPPFGG